MAASCLELNLVAYGSVEVGVVASQFYCSVGEDAAAAHRHGDAGSQFQPHGSTLSTFDVGAGGVIDEAHGCIATRIAEVVLSQYGVKSRSLIKRTTQS